MKKFFISIFIFSIIVQQVLAHGKEFKNMLVDLEIARAGEETYKVNLKTEIPYPDEIKIVKKSDYNYYILLAETYSLIKTTKSSGVIKSIKVDTYPYAEQNFENGFTKVTFNTTRPVDFVVSLSANKASKFPVMDLVRLARLDNLYKENNFDYLNPKYKVAAATVPTKSQVAPQKQQVAQKEVKAPQKEVQKQVPSVKPAQAQKQTPVQKVAQQQVQKETVKKQTVAQKQVPSVKVAQAPKQTSSAKVAQATKPVTPPIAAKKVEKAPAPTVSHTKEQPKQANKVKNAPNANKQEQQNTNKVAQKPKQQAPKVENKLLAEKQVEKTTPQNQNKKEQPQTPKQQANSPEKVANADVQSPKEIPHEFDINEDKTIENIELEPIEKIDEDPVQNDFKNILLSFLIGNKISILAGLVLLLALSAVYSAKKRQAHTQHVPHQKDATEAPQEQESFENVVASEADDRQYQVPAPQELTEETVPSEVVPDETEAQEVQEVQEEMQIIQAQEDTETQDISAQEKITAEEEIEVENLQKEEISETQELDDAQTLAQQIQETQQAQEIEEDTTAETPDIPQEISQEKIEEDIEQEIQQEIANGNAKLLEETQEFDTDNLEVAEIKEEIVSAMDNVLNPTDEALELPKEENIVVHNLDVINRQAPSGNYDDDLIEIDEIKDEIKEIKNNFAHKEVDMKNDTLQTVSEEKPQTVQNVVHVEIPKQIQNAIPKPAIESKQMQELKPTRANVQKQNQQKPTPIKKAPVKKAPVARILCKAPIENDRGLYLADYAGNKALVGYVNNNVFVLYNFKKAKIMNNEIIFRLSEAKPKEDLYYVMVDNKKFLIKSEQYRMSLMQKIS